MQSLLRGCTLRTRKVPTQIFGNVRCPILHIKINSTLLCWCGLASDILNKKSRLNWKVKVSNTADNAGITQSQARDTRHCRMQELNRLCVSKCQQLCHLSSTPVGNALFEPILQCLQIPINPSSHAYNGIMHWRI